jgi:hypothetical protein
VQEALDVLLLAPVALLSPAVDEQPIIAPAKVGAGASPVGGNFCPRSGHHSCDASLELGLEEDPVLLEAFGDLGALVRAALGEPAGTVQALRVGHEDAGIQANDARSARSGIVKQTIEDRRAKVQITPLRVDVHALHLGDVDGEHPQRPDAGCLAVALREQEPALWGPLVVKVVTNFGGVCGRFLDCELAREPLVCPLHVVHRQSCDRRVILAR